MHGSLNIRHFGSEMDDTFENAHAAVRTARQQLENRAVFVEPLGSVDVKIDDASQYLHKRHNEGAKRRGADVKPERSLQSSMYRATVTSLVKIPFGNCARYGKLATCMNERVGPNENEGFKGNEISVNGQRCKQLNKFKGKFLNAYPRVLLI
jgi:hypothetical protein